MKTTLIPLFLLLALSSCLPKFDKSSLKFDGIKQSQMERSTAETSFGDLKAKVLIPKCIGCHADFKNESGFQAKNITLGEPDNSKLFNMVKAGRMPVGPKQPDGTRVKVDPLTSEELELVRGYIEHAKPAHIEIYPEKVTFEDLKAKVLDNNCLMCHRKWIDEASFLEKNVVPGDGEASKMYDAVLMARMPKAPKKPDGTPGKVIPLSEKDQALIRIYIDGLKPISGSFTEMKKAILVPKCLACHRKWTNEASFLEKNVVKGDADNSKMFDSVVKARMPKAPKNTDGTAGAVIPLSTEELEMMRNYINGLKP